MCRAGVKHMGYVPFSGGAASAGCTVLDHSLGQDRSLGHFDFLAFHWLYSHQIRYMMYITTY